MTFKKFLRIKKNNKAQASMEYFILLAVIALLTLLSLSTFPNTIIRATQGNPGGQNGFFQAMIGSNGLNIDNRVTTRP